MSNSNDDGPVGGGEADVELPPQPGTPAASAPNPTPPVSATPAAPATAVATAPIPAPKLAPKRAGIDSVAAVAMLTFVLVGGLLVFGFAQALVPAAQAQLGAACRPLSPVAKSGAPPDIELEDLDGNPVSLADFRGKFLVVNFWATWCDPCSREWPDLDTLAERMADRDDVAIIAISIDQQVAEIGPYLERMGLTDTRVTILRAKPTEAHKLWGSEMIPDTYFVGRDGDFEAVFVNLRAWGRAKAVRCVSASADAD